MVRAASLLAGAGAFALLLAGPAAARTVAVTAGPLGHTTARLHMDAFFSSNVTIHPGDKVRWTINGFHDVVFVPKGKAAPAFVSPDAAHPVTWAQDAAGLPFWFDGQPSIAVTPLAGLPTGGTKVDGSKLVGSGLAAGSGKAKPITFTFPKVGTYRYQCLVHPGMNGVVEVVPKSGAIPGPAKIKPAARKEFAAAMKTATKLGKVKPPAGEVLAGNDKGPVAWLRFFPSTITVKVGQPVKFTVKSKPEAHTVTFGPAAYTTAIEKGFVQVTPNPTGPPRITLNPLGVYPSDPPAVPLVDTGANHGNGFVNSGLLDADPATPQGATATFTFTKAGTYRYECVIHPGMDGVVIVSPPA
jgi:plastocyanin